MVPLSKEAWKGRPGERKEQETRAMRGEWVRKARKRSRTQSRERKGGAEREGGALGAGSAELGIRGVSLDPRWSRSSWA